MVMNLKELPAYRAAVEKLSKEMSAGAGIEEQEKLFAEAFNILGEELNTMASDKLETLFEARSKHGQLSAAEIEFFNDVAKIADNPGVKTEKIIPEELMVRVFDDLKTEHPLLTAINFKNTGLRLKALIAETTGDAKWGPIYGDIKGQLNQSFNEVDFGMNKLTAFVVVPKDALKFSYQWLKQFIIEQIKEAISVALELAIVKGTGENQPVGLIKDLSRPGTSGSLVTYPNDKSAMADLSTITPETAPTLLAPVMKHLAVNDKGRIQSIDGKVSLLVNPSDRWMLEAKLTHLTDGGAYTVTLPYGIKLIESAALETGKAIAFVADRYDAFMAAKAEIEEFDQTFALEDLQLFTTKSYYYGKAKDNHASAVLTLAGG